MTRGGRGPAGCMRGARAPIALRGGHPFLAALLTAAIAPSWVVPGAAARASSAGSAGGPTAPLAAAIPVTGGGGFADAPLLGAGVYSDTLLPRETLFYAVSLGSGERARVRATVDVSVGSRSIQDLPDAAAAFREIRLFTPLRQQLPSEDLSVDEAGEDFESVAVEVESPRAVSAAAAGRRAARNEYWMGPGIYLMAITFSKITSALGATVELPLQLAIEVDGRPGTGAPAARPSPGPLGDPRAGPPVAAAAARAADGSSSEPIGAGLLAAGGAGGIVLGAAAGYGIGARRRRPS